MNPQCRNMLLRAISLMLVETVKREPPVQDNHFRIARCFCEN